MVYISKKDAIQLSQRIWKAMAESGLDNDSHPESEEWKSKYNNREDSCPLCQYAIQDYITYAKQNEICYYCPLWEQLRLLSCSPIGFFQWAIAERGSERRKELAKHIYETLLKLKG